MKVLVFMATVAAGGIGAALRYLLSQWLSFPAHRYPWALLIVNASGGFFIVAIMMNLQEPAMTILGSGLLGGFTTFSSVSGAAGELWRAGQFFLAGWVTVSLFVGTLLGAALGGLLFSFV